MPTRGVLLVIFHGGASRALGSTSVCICWWQGLPPPLDAVPGELRTHLTQRSSEGSYRTPQEKEEEGEKKSSGA